MNSVAKTAFEEFKTMISHAVDRQELGDIRSMILEASDLTFSEKQSLSDYLSGVWEKLMSA